MNEVAKKIFTGRMSVWKLNDCMKIYGSGDEVSRKILKAENLRIITIQAFWYIIRVLSFSYFLPQCRNDVALLIDAFHGSFFSRIFLLAFYSRTWPTWPGTSRLLGKMNVLFNFRNKSFLKLLCATFFVCSFVGFFLFLFEIFFSSFLSNGNLSHGDGLIIVWL